MEQKEQVLKLEDSNMAYMGSELEQKVRHAAAEKEDAWKGVGQEPGLVIWRIEKFQVVPWPKEEYGSFYSGDSYIVLHTYKKNDKLFWNAHMWVGTFTTMDEAGTAAYKVVELDDLFHREIVLFREVQGFESEVFVCYFKTIRVMDGGIESGFRKVPVETYRPRLLHIRKCKSGFRVSEVPLTTDSMNSGDCFILDSGLILYNWTGSLANAFEKFRAASMCQDIISERNGKGRQVNLTEGTDANEDFWKLLGGKGEIKAATAVTDDSLKSFDSKMFQLSDASGELVLKPVKLTKDSLTTDDVFIVDLGIELMIWIGKNSTTNEKKSSLGFAQQHLQDNNRPSHIPFCCMSEGRESFRFQEVLAL